MKRKFCLLLLTIAVLLSISIQALAHSRSNHDKEMEKVFFGGKATSEQKDMAKALEAAAYLTIDQFGGNGQKNLDLLESYVDDLPELEEIDISKSETSHHREYTHQGWTSKYHDIQSRGDNNLDEEWKKKWKLRKKILEDTVESIFKFNWWSGIPLIGRALPDYGAKGDSLCALIYYTHLLGDHEETEKMDQYNYLLPVGGKVNNKDIIHEIMYHCNVIFEAQSDSREFSLFTMKLEEINSKYYKLIKIDSTNIGENQKYASEVLQVLQDYIPEFLEYEDFYQNSVA